MKKMSTGQNLYYDGYGSYDYPKKILRRKPLEEVKKFFFKTACLENLTTKKISTGLSVLRRVR